MIIKTPPLKRKVKESRARRDSITVYSAIMPLHQEVERILKARDPGRGATEGKEKPREGDLTVADIIIIRKSEKDLHLLERATIGLPSQGTDIIIGAPNTKGEISRKEGNPVLHLLLHQGLIYREKGRRKLQDKIKK